MEKDNKSVDNKQIQQPAKKNKIVIREALPAEERQIHVLIAVFVGGIMGILLVLFSIFGDNFSWGVIGIGLFFIGGSLWIAYMYYPDKIAVIDYRGVYWALKKRMISWEKINSLTCEFRSQYGQYLICYLNDKEEIQFRLGDSNYNYYRLYIAITNKFPDIQCRLIED